MDLLNFQSQMFRFANSLPCCSWDSLSHVLISRFRKQHTSNSCGFKLFSDSLGFCQLFLDCSLETCLQRNGQRPRPLPAETIHLMGRKIEEPNPEKNAWEHNSLTIQSPACASKARYPTQSHPLLGVSLRAGTVLNALLASPWSASHRPWGDIVLSPSVQKRKRKLSFPSITKLVTAEIRI